MSSTGMVLLGGAIGALFTIPVGVFVLLFRSSGFSPWLAGGIRQSVWDWLKGILLSLGIGMGSGALLSALVMLLTGTDDPVWIGVSIGLTAAILISLGLTFISPGIRLRQRLSGVLTYMRYLGPLGAGIGGIAGAIGGYFFQNIFRN